MLSQIKGELRVLYINGNMRVYFLALAFLLQTVCYGQITIVFDPITNPRSLQTIGQITLVNTNTPITSIVEVEVRTSMNDLVVRMRSNPIYLSSGSTRLTGNSVTFSSMQFGSSRFADVLRVAGNFPPGNYEFCYSIFEDNKSATPPLLGQECFLVELSPIGNIELVYPANRDSLCSVVTTLQWTPIIPAPQGIQYQLYLTELRQDQTSSEAIMTNLPIINSRNLLQNFYSLQQFAHLLQNGKSYAWQVIGYIGNQPVDRSEVWTFTYGCPIDPAIPKGDSYRSLDNMQWGNYLRVNEILRFSINNPYGKLPVKYSIRNLANLSEQVRQLPKLVLQHGINYVDIDLTDCKGLEKGTSYELIVQLPGHSPKKLLFIYE